MRRLASNRPAAPSSYFGATDQPQSLAAPPIVRAPRYLHRLAPLSVIKEIATIYIVR